MIGYYAETKPDGRYQQCHIVELPSEAAPEPAVTGNVLVPVNAPPASWVGPTATSVLYLIDGVEQWVETSTLPSLQEAAINKAYADVDAVTWDAVGVRTEEYRDAENDARAFIASGYTEPAPESVACWARKNSTGLPQTNQWAADGIVQRADAFAQAKLAMRVQRMEAQFDMRASTTLEELTTAISNWNAFIANMRLQLGLPNKS